MSLPPSHPPSRLRCLGYLPLVSPVWLVLGLLLVLPLLGVVWLSFARSDGSGGTLPIGGFAEWWDYLRSGEIFANHAHTIAPRPAAIFWRSLWMAAVTTILCGLVAYPVAYYIAVRAPARLKGLLLLLAVIPFWTSFLVRTYAWQVILAREGPLNGLLISIGVTNEPFNLLYNELAVMVGLVYGELPFMILPLYASLEKLDRSLLEASTDLGAGPWATFRRITLPLSMPGLVAGAVLVFVPSVGQFVVSDLLGGGKVYLLGNLIEERFRGSAGSIPDPPAGAAVAMQMTLMVLLMVWMYARWARRRGEEVLL